MLWRRRRFSLRGNDWMLIVNCVAIATTRCVMMIFDLSILRIHVI
jgi:hypothetical protein